MASICYQRRRRGHQVHDGRYRCLETRTRSTARSSRWSRAKSAVKRRHRSAVSVGEHTHGALILRHQEETINVQKPNQINGNFVSTAFRKIHALNNHLLSGCCKTAFFPHVFIPSESFCAFGWFQGQNCLVPNRLGGPSFRLCVNYIWPR